MIEISSPAGNLESALIALRSGADSVYFGLKDFSARKGAENFSIEDLSKLKEQTARQHKKIYVAFNTLVDDRDLDKAFRLLNEIYRYDVDGIIVQDLGIARLIKRYFPEMPLHASTQLAVHTSEGVKTLRRLGFKRAVLSRELSLDEIKKIREENPDIELKCFIQGAMCYGVSGLCMASHIITGRSANEGECAQICRTYFTDDEKGITLYPFSMKDLAIEDYIKELDRIGIDSAKIEGRMKGNNYIASTAMYYKAILNNEDRDELRKRALSSFKRESSIGFLNYKTKSDDRKVSTEYSGHIGECLGVAEIRGEFLSLSKRVDPYDVLMVLRKTKNGLLEPIKFPAIPIKTGRDGTLVKMPDIQIEDGETIYRVAMGSYSEKKSSLNLPLYRKRKNILLEIENNGIKIDGFFEKAIPTSSNENWEMEIRRVFERSGEADFSVRKLDIINKSSIEFPSYNRDELKEVRNRLYKRLSENKETKEYSYEGKISDEAPTLPKRSLLSSKDGLPWNEEGVFIDGYTYISLSPISFKRENHYDDVLRKFKGQKNIRVGINNIDALFLYEKYPEFEYFADIYLYLPNREAAMFLLEHNPRIIGGYLWCERNSFDKPWPFTPMVSNKVSLPLFISRSCYRHDSLGYDCKDCKKDYEFNLTQQKNRYRALVKDCITYILKSK